MAVLGVALLLYRLEYVDSSRERRVRKQSAVSHVRCGIYKLRSFAAGCRMYTADYM